MRPSATLIVPDGSQRILVIAPHPDDETLGCGGAIALHAEAGDVVCVLIVTDGGSSMASGLARHEIAPLRKAEAQAAVARLLGQQTYSLHLLDLPEGMWSPDELQAPLSGLLAEFQPSVIYTPSCVDFHPQHLMVAEALATAFVDMPDHTCRVVRVYELQVPLTPVLANVMVDITPAVRRKVAALGEYRTQRGSFDWVPRAARYLRGLYRVKGTIEVFWELEPFQFCQLMRHYRQTRPRFRSIRMRPLSDGLAWLVGTRSRIRLMRLAAGHVQIDNPTPHTYTF